ncbi:hypothetical protein V6N11_028601 [Hibiscus sabdariffa]|uniref:Uncharacterized protein n=1 Tax=Hibiscus sabdariffa TaxID=183260 RepID=A0ABR2A6G2_9ROSI
MSSWGRSSFRVSSVTEGGEEEESDVRGFLLVVIIIIGGLERVHGREKLEISCLVSNLDLLGEKEDAMAFGLRLEDIGMYKMNKNYNSNLQSHR